MSGLADNLGRGLGLGNLFEGSTEELPGPRILEEPWHVSARQFIMDLMSGKGLTGLSEDEEFGQTMLGQFVRGNLLEDPLDSAEFSGFRKFSEGEESRTVNQLRRRQQLEGGLSSSGGAGEEGRLRRDFSNQRTQFLGNLFNIERSRDNPGTRLSALANFGGLERNVNNQNLSTQAGAAQQLLAYRPYYQPQFSSSPSPFSMITSGIGNMIPGAPGGTDAPTISAPTPSFVSPNPRANPDLLDTGANFRRNY